MKPLKKKKKKTTALLLMQFLLRSLLNTQRCPPENKQKKVLYEPPEKGYAAVLTEGLVVPKCGLKAARPAAERRRGADENRSAIGAGCRRRSALVERPASTVAARGERDRQERQKTGRDLARRRGGAPRATRPRQQLGRAKCSAPARYASTSSSWRRRRARRRTRPTRPARRVPGRTAAATTASP